MISGKAVLLTGDMGKEGQRLTALLAEMSISTIQTFRSGETTTEPDASNVKAVTFDWNDECIWNTALAESQPHSGNLVASQFLDMLPPVERLIDLARSKTVKRFILPSGRPLHPTEEGIAVGHLRG